MSARQGYPTRCITPASQDKKGWYDGHHGHDSIARVQCIFFFQGSNLLFHLHNLVPFLVIDLMIFFMLKISRYLLALALKITFFNLFSRYTPNVNQTTKDFVRTNVYW